VHFHFKPIAPIERRSQADGLLADQAAAVSPRSRFSPRLGYSVGYIAAFASKNPNQFNARNQLFNLFPRKSREVTTCL
jgi:tRNA U34 5-methylaminomethyl-2-thiouridine-forming methyltransferase MnmC